MPKPNTGTKPLSPPPNTLSAERWQDFPNSTSPAHYLVEDGAGASKVITVSKLTRRVLDGLIERPIYCASRCRISEYVRQLKHELGVQIETDWYSNDKASGGVRYGVYRLVSKVSCVDNQEQRS